ncbi:hypothetical protein QJ528_10690 [Staphylococcus warneri]|uniref:hypothetical protein n=1 Tax=Staphylococcus warneri TaxID=1292 RepID=UPI002541A896|nr:hypothetical protein [Staphylococcus warneri]MDK4214530.1 hypothetical protein [Staphylococcus warneri]
MASEDLSGKQFGDFKIIGDTGKRDKKGQAIVIARHIETGKLFESVSTRFRNNTITGYIGSSRHKKQQMEVLKERKKSGIHDSFYSNSKSNLTGYKNVSYSKSNVCWQVNITFNNKQYHKKFRDFYKAVMYVNNFKIKYVNPLIEDEELKFISITENDIYVNDYVKTKQEIIDEKNNKIGSNHILYNTINKIKRGKGYCFDKRYNKWMAYININKKRKHLGYFPTEQQAIEARQKAVDEQIKILEKQLEEL